MCVHHVFQQTAFTNQKDFGKEAREAKWAAEQRTLHGLQSAEMASMFSQRGTFRDINLMAEEARRRAEISRSVPLINYTTILHGNWLNFKLTEYHSLGGRCLVWHRFSLFILPWEFLSWTWFISMIVLYDSFQSPILSHPFFTLQVERASHSERKGWVLCQAEGSRHWFQHQSALHCLSVAVTAILMSSLISFPFHFLLVHGFVSNLKSKMVGFCMTLIIHMARLFYKSSIACLDLYEWLHCWLPISAHTNLFTPLLCNFLALVQKFDVGIII